MPEYGLRDRVALITGANRREGIGAATALALVAVGARVVLTYHQPATERPADNGSPGSAHYLATQFEDPGWLAEKINSAGGSALCIKSDLADPSAASTLFDACEQAFGRVEILVNNAAHCVADTFVPIGAPTPFNPVASEIRPFTAASFDEHVAVNDRATALLITEFAARHVRRSATWGRIVNLSSDGAPIFPTQVSYGATKYAIESITASAGQELGQFGITVNVVSPGPIQTGYIPPEAEAGIVSTIPLGRLGRPDDVADVVVFLCSNQARWLTGQILYVGGGKKML